MINETLEGLDICFTYLDDIIIYSKTEQEHLTYIRQIFNDLSKGNMKLKCTKCDFFQIPNILPQTPTFKRRNILQKIRNHKSHATPKNIKEIGLLLGLNVYYINHISNYADITHALTHLRKDTNITG